MGWAERRARASRALIDRGLESGGDPLGSRFAVRGQGSSAQADSARHAARQVNPVGRPPPGSWMGSRGPRLVVAGPDTFTPVLPDAPGLSVEAWRNGRGTVYGYAYRAAGYFWLHMPALATFRLGRSPRVTALPAPGVSRAAVEDAYQRTVIPASLQLLGFEVLHSSAIVMPRGVVALCAVSGTGKSTIAYGLSRRGHRLWADDTVALELAGPSVWALPLPFRVRLEASAAALFGHDAATTGAGATVLGTERVPLLALCVLTRVAGSDVVRSARLAPAQAFVAVLAHAHAFALDEEKRKRRLVRHYLDLTRRIPVFDLHFHGDLGTLPVLLDHIEDLIGGA